MRRKVFFVLFFVFSVSFLLVIVLLFRHDSVEFTINNGTTSVIDSIYISNIEGDIIWSKKILPFQCKNLHLVFRKGNVRPGSSAGIINYEAWSKQKKIRQAFVGDYPIGYASMDGKLKFHIKIDKDSVKAYKQFEEKFILVSTTSWEENK